LGLGPMRGSLSMRYKMARKATNGKSNSSKSRGVTAYKEQRKIMIKE